MSIDVIIPDWPAPPRVRALTTTRGGGVSTGPYTSLNLGDHVGDMPATVARNRALLRQHARLPGEPNWLSQVHGCEVCSLGPQRLATPPLADAAVADAPGVVCAVLTADCLPVVLCNAAGTVVAAAHAGWRGLADGVLEATVAALSRAAALRHPEAGSPSHLAPSGHLPAQRPAQLMAWLGPAIGPQRFEVGAEVRAAFIAHDSAAATAFMPSEGGRWLADLYTLARQRLAHVGVTRVSGGEYCTHAERGDFFSYRRDGVTGRMATVIWIEPTPAVSR